MSEEKKIDEELKKELIGKAQEEQSKREKRKKDFEEATKNLEGKIPTKKKEE